MSQVMVRDSLVKPGMDPAVAAAYQLLGLLPNAHEIVVAKARTGLLAMSTSPRRWDEIEQAYQVICEHRQRPGKGS